MLYSLKHVCVVFFSFQDLYLCGSNTFWSGVWQKMWDTGIVSCPFVFLIVIIGLKFIQHCATARDRLGTCSWVLCSSVKDCWNQTFYVTKLELFVYFRWHYLCNVPVFNAFTANVEKTQRTVWKLSKIQDCKIKYKFICVLFTGCLLYLLLANTILFSYVC